MNIAQLKGRSVAVLGAGVEGRAALAAIGARVGFESLTLLDETPLEPMAQVSVRSGPLATLNLADFDVIVRSPGFSVYRPELQAARQSGVMFTSGTSLWLAEVPPGPVIAVTGTKGKSTTTSLLGHLLTEAGLSVQLGGNLGQPVISFLNQPVPDWYVVELSSYQLADLEGHVDIAVLTSLLTDHVDWHGSITQYHQDKLRLLDMSRNSRVVAHRVDQETLCGRSNTVWAGGADSWRVDGEAIYCQSQKISTFKGWDLPGRHNLNNLEVALATIEVCGVKVQDALPGIATFSPLPHRLEPVVSAPVTCINDSIATTPDATLAALRCFPAQPVVVIVGGLDRLQRWDVLVAGVKDRQLQGLETHVVVQGQGAEAIVSTLSQALAAPYLHRCADLPTAVERSLQLCAPGWVLLLSPGAPSFDQYLNFAERGDVFSQYCRNYFSVAG